MSEPLVLLARDGDVVTLTFNDPSHLNAMTQAMGEAFATCVTELAGDPSLRAVVLTGAGRAFSAGGDLTMIESRAAAGAANGPRGRGAIRDGMRSFYKLFLAVREIPCPTIAAVNGAAIGAGLCVALACDVRIASSEAKLGLNFTQLGLHPGMGATWTLPRLVGGARAAEILFSSRIFTGAEAATIGLVNRAVAAGRRGACGARARGGVRGGGAARGARREARARAQRRREPRRPARLRGAGAGGVLRIPRRARGLASARERRAPKFEGR